MRRNSGDDQKKRKVIDDDFNCLSISRIAFSIKTSLRILPFSQTSLRIIIHSPCSLAGCVLLFCDPMCRGKRDGETGENERHKADEKTGCIEEKSKQHGKAKGNIKAVFNSSYFRFMCLSPLYALLPIGVFVSFHYEFKV